MTQSQRDRLFTALLGPMAKAAEPVLREMEQYVTEDLDMIEPIVDDMVREAFETGVRFGAVLVDQESTKVA